MLGNGNTVVVELSEALARVVPVDDPHFLYASDGAERGRAGAQDRVPVLGRTAGSTGRTTFLAFGGAYHGDTIGALSLGGGGFGTSIFDPLRFPVRARARVRRARTASTRRSALVGAARATSSRR